MRQNRYRLILLLYVGGGVTLWLVFNSVLRDFGRDFPMLTLKGICGLVALAMVMTGIILGIRERRQHYRDGTRHDGP